MKECHCYTGTCNILAECGLQTETGLLITSSTVNLQDHFRDISLLVMGVIRNITTDIHVDLILL